MCTYLIAVSQVSYLICAISDSSSLSFSVSLLKHMHKRGRPHAINLVALSDDNDVGGGDTASETSKN